MAIDQPAQFAPPLCRKVSARMTISRRALASVATGSPVEIVPDLNGDKSDQKTENDAERRQHAWRRRLEGAPPRIDRKADHDEIDGGGDKKDGAKHQERHLGEGQI